MCAAGQRTGCHRDGEERLQMPCSIEDVQLVALEPLPLTTRRSKPNRRVPRPRPSPVLLGTGQNQPFSAANYLRQMSARTGLPVSRERSNANTCSQLLRRLGVDCLQTH
jgi:hypothetical protein